MNNKQSGLVFLCLCALFATVLLIIFLNEFFPTTHIDLVNGVIVFLGLACIYLFVDLPTKFKKKLSLFSKVFLAGTLILFLFHMLTNSFNIYSHATLPAFFYTFKLYRIVSLSATSIVQLTLFAVSCYFAVSSTKDIFTLSRIKWFFYPVIFYLLILLVVQGTRALAIVYRDTLQVAVNMNASFENRITYRLGGISYYGWIWPYTRFIIKHTPESAVIAIPPQSVVWKMEGNSDYLRWYIYPRKIVKELSDGSLPPDAEYALIALGECGEGTCGWPKIRIPKEKIEYIALINRDTEEEQIITATDYTFDTHTFKWGIIKLKK